MDDQTKQCPQCKGTVSQNAQECPLCGIIFKRYEEAKDTLNKDAISAYENGDLPHSKKLFERLIQSFPGLTDSAQIYLKKIEDRESNQLYEKALSEYEQGNLTDAKILFEDLTQHYLNAPTTPTNDSARKYIKEIESKQMESESPTENRGDSLSSSNSLDSKLIACPDCGKQVSRRAPSCPHCGCPVTEVIIENLPTESNLLPPEFPENLSLGDVPFSMTDGFTALIEEGGSTIAAVSLGPKRVLFHRNGIQINGTLMSASTNPQLPYNIHYSQIIDAKYSDRTSMVKWIEKEKTVIGRAIAGAIICGPIGAIIGGISGIGKKKIGNPHYLIVNFWEINDSPEATPQTLLFCGKGFMKKVDFVNSANKINKERDKWIKT